MRPVYGHPGYLDRIYATANGKKLLPRPIEPWQQQPYGALGHRIIGNFQLHSGQGKTWAKRGRQVAGIDQPDGSRTIEITKRDQKWIAIGRDIAAGTKFLDFGGLTSAVVIIPRIKRVES